MEEKRKGYKTKKGQLAANKRYLDSHPEQKAKNRILTYRATSKNFIKNYATLEDIVEIRQLLDEREKFLIHQST